MNSNTNETRADRIVKVLPQIFTGALTKGKKNPKLSVDVTNQQFRALNTIMNFPEITVNDLANRLNIAQSTASQLIDRLYEAGLIDTLPDKSDRRKAHIILTKKGIKVTNEKMEAIKKSYEKLLSYMDEHTQENFEKAVIKLVEEYISQ
ncbi:MAG TPA: MarR family transcriptional regulator [Ignavibacteriales bacterium]|nr:MarR family transcriptional regulator [Ignavibacteriales bacterium]HOL80429.1 MarR family transcriptional regulator [Ignavibacteriales bacterium]HPP32618.1 MarR family transcriptional regulator [Ignavibacteriales bacterium]